MKSMLHEASTVSKAVAKAWDESGQPYEFTIKVLESEKKGFFGLTTKQPAIISISYDPKKQTKRVAKEKPKPQKTFQKRNPQQYRSQDKYKQRTNNDQRNNDPRDYKSQPYQQSNDQQAIKKTNSWNDEWIDTIDTNLKKITSIMGISTKFTTNVDRRTLHILFDQNILPTSEEERMLFISLSYLLMQFLKKKCKKKLSGFHLVIKSKRLFNNDKDRSTRR